MTFKQIISRFTGISIPVFGVQWNPTEPEIAVAQRVITFLEDRRLLFNPFHMECLGDCVQSAVKIREFLTEEIGKLPSKDSALAEHLRAMRAACRQYLDNVQVSGRGRIIHPYGDGYGSQEFFTALGELRAAMGFRIGILAVMYGLSVDGDLEKILPPKVGAQDA